MSLSIETLSFHEDVVFPLSFVHSNLERPVLQDSATPRTEELSSIINSPLNTDAIPDVDAEIISNNNYTYTSTTTSQSSYAPSSSESFTELYYANVAQQNYRLWLSKF
ncbi:hypothetical protein KAFR_0A07230 [Kazachstania africana CBS 2517]|uniref:Uncharacterized protein n=1 Tax=Kazachstania africana (strain ATCC 22294 / BCRC 22015 / CBS 2517 / CECT 1963 / NBRC 1671 / NRRL Y-8276) TaxID=1071382 RepID=H2AP57_KAZAF|nr:hypothetical protein KAFR_0A07230 [Kazachstania africana CBS 2517]CCF56157.1 hypothetical protein KAFR_0A07230 [Kazachstania africana CBS 2517]